MGISEKAGKKLKSSIRISIRPYRSDPELVGIFANFAFDEVLPTYAQLRLCGRWSFWLP